MPALPQQSVILFFLVAGWLVYITAKGELPAYIGVMLGNK